MYFCVGWCTKSRESLPMPITRRTPDRVSRRSRRRAPARFSSGRVGPVFWRQISMGRSTCARVSPARGARTAITQHRRQRPHGMDLATRTRPRCAAIGFEAVTTRSGLRQRELCVDARAAVRSQIRVLAGVRVTRDQVSLAAGTYSIRLQSPPICGGLASAICRVGCGEDGRAERRRRHDHPLRAQRAPALLDIEKNGDRPFNPTSTRLLITVFARHHCASWRSTGGVIRQNGSRRSCPTPSQIAPAIWRATGGERFRAQALRARECSPQGGRPHVQRDQRRASRRSIPCPPRPIERRPARINVKVLST